MATPSTPKTAWLDATMACVNHLCREMGFKFGKSAFIGDFLPINAIGWMAFIISGSPNAQEQNYQVRVKGTAWAGDAVILGQFEDVETALEFGGLIQDALPGKKGGEPSGARGLDPNVKVFEATLHPELVSIRFGEGGKEQVRWIVRQECRVVYDNTQN